LSYLAMIGNLAIRYSGQVLCADIRFQNSIAQWHQIFTYCFININNSEYT
jgi:hypothetical protein